MVEQHASEVRRITPLPWFISMCFLGITASGASVEWDPVLIKSAIYLLSITPPEVHRTHSDPLELFDSPHSVQ